MLTGKCKDKFEKWLGPVIQDNIALPSETVTFEDIQAFYEYPFAMQWGVYLEFFDSVGILIEVKPYKPAAHVIDLYAEVYDDIRFVNYELPQKDTRPAAQAAAINKANEIFNAKQL